MFPYATFFISFLLICSSICVNAQSEREVSDQIDVLSLEFIQQNPEHALAKINRLLTQVSNDNSLQNITALLQKKADVFLHTLESEQGVHVLDSALLLARKYDLAIDRSKIYSRKSTFLARLGKVDETFTTLDSVLLYINESPPDDRGGYLAQTYYLRARLQDRSGQLEAAMESYLKALEVAKATGSTAKIMDVYLQLGYVHKALNNLPQAIKSHQQSLQYSRQLADTTYQIYNYVFLAGAYLKTAKFDSIASKQKEYLQQAFQYLQTANSLA
ncbi:MAG: tetratricopeptide repeat protein, partial [Bacteroidota bacterium]